MSEVASVSSDVIALDAAVQGDVSIGLIGTTGRWLVPQLLAAQRQRHPLIRLRLVEGTNSSLGPRVVQGQLELAVLYSRSLRPISTTPNSSARTSFSLCLATTTSLVKSVTLEILARMDLLLPLSGTSLRREIDDACAQRGLTLRALIELDGMRTLASLAFDGHGPAILPATALPTHLSHRFFAVPIEGLPPRRVGLAVRRYGFPATPVRAIREMIFRLVGEAEQLPHGVHPLVGSQL
jgi:LysR family hydrogen peroxide-inducible transcriptional activator